MANLYQVRESTKNFIIYVNLQKTERRSYYSKPDSETKCQVIFPFTTRRLEWHCRKISKLETRPSIS